MSFDIAALNAMPAEDFIHALGGIFEHSPWIPASVVDARPFASIAALHAALNATLADPAVQSRLTEEGVEIEPSAAPQDFGRLIEEDRQRWQQVVTRTNIRAE